MKPSLYFLRLVIFYLFVLGISLHGHGFGANTLVRTSGGWWRIEQVCRQVCSNENPQIASYDLNLSSCVKRYIKSAGESEINCYFRLGFDEWFNDDVLCTPTQEFYLPLTKQWIPAYQLKIGDQLLSECNTKSITHIEFVKKPLKVYSIEIEETHTFFVGRHSILTHNMLLPVLSAGLGISFGAGAAAGGVAGSFLGPATFVGGIVVGGLIGIAVKKLSCNEQIPTYQLFFNTNDIDQYFQNNKSDDVQAPGKPTEEDGYEPPKKWDGKKVKNPNGPGYGWPDRKGKVWIPTGPNGHGCPHWDVEASDGSYQNIVPGGRIRGQK